MEFYYLSISFLIGFTLIIFMGVMVRYNILKDARLEAQEILQNTQSQNEETQSNQKNWLEEFQQKAQEEFETIAGPLKLKIEEHEELINEKQSQIEDRMIEKQSQCDKKRSGLQRLSSQIDNTKKYYKNNVISLENLKLEYSSKLTKKYSISMESLRGELKIKLINEEHERLTRWAQTYEEDFQSKSEKYAADILYRVLNRFQRPYCAERGLGYVNLKDTTTKEKLFGSGHENIRLIEKLCGVDLIYAEETNSISASGFDPVRRELARSVVEELIRNKSIDEKVIRHTVEKIKKQLFKKIHQDGKRITGELNIKPFASEVTNTLGSLRYRYSFAQNQYFHCGEVGHLCGLLASELNESIKDAKRAGLLHDIGKAMDHSIDGGHAVIGADFIEKHNEAPHIVHAVRAHHYDEPPETQLAYLVIAADALSGARPGARRSTADSYMQKISQLEEIGNSFEEVIETYIMSAGREIRLVVDGDKISEKGIIELSKNAANKIEEECNYPGLIKVTIVRSTRAVAYAK